MILVMENLMIQKNLDHLYSRINTACKRSDRDAKSINLIVVGKTFPIEKIIEAYDLGIRVFGENKALELRDKFNASHESYEINWHMIGHLQTNKIKYISPFIASFHALDSLRLAEKLNSKMEQQQKTLDVFIQINTSKEISKYGIEPSELKNFLSESKRFPNLKVIGLMTLAIHSTEEQEVRACFRLLRELRDEFSDTYPELKRLSMGMSSDFEIAIEEGATDLRIGQSIFGNRSTPDSFYWPEK